VDGGIDDDRPYPVPMLDLAEDGSLLVKVS
jgi:hypothetical protein